VQHHPFWQLQCLPRRPAVDEPGLAAHQTTEGLVVGALDRLRALGEPIEHRGQARIAPGRR
jgi:hypothetical protein